MKRISVFIIVGFLLVTVQIAFSATYSLKWTGNGRTTINGDTFCSGKCNPGDIIILPPGTTNDGLYIMNLHGDDKNPIMIKNTAGEKTIIDTKYSKIHPVYGNGILIQSSKHLKIDGSNGLNESNESFLTYGIRITNCAYKGVFLNKGTDEIELQYIEIDNVGNDGYNQQGIGIKENSKIGEENVPQGTILKGLYIHHNYVHNTTTEGIYLGASGSCSGSLPDCCNSLDDSDDAVIWENVKVYNNKIESTGWDAISVSCCQTSNVFENTITNAGLGKFPSIGQGVGLSLNKGFGGAVYSNKIINTQKQGISWQGTGKTDIYNNIVANVGQMSTAISYERIGIADAGDDNVYLTIKYNTIINSPFEAIRLQSNQIGLIQDNLYVKVGVANSYGKTFAINSGLTKKSINECYFRDPDLNNYALTVNTPKDISIGGQENGYPIYDINNVERKAGYVSVGAHNIQLTEVGYDLSNKTATPKNLIAR